MSATSKRLALASFLIILAFLPSLFAELSTVDDLGMYKWLAASDPTLKNLFFPQDSGGAYYRPLIWVSYLFDKHVWMLDTRLMHLDNLLFHLVNAFLVYYLASLLLPQAEHHKNNISLVAALLFGLHPLTTESVAWISGRTDIMAGTFVLLSTVFLIRFRGTRRIIDLVLAVLVLLPGLLIKETPLAFMLGAIFILSARDAEAVDPLMFNFDSGRDVFRCALYAGIAVVLLLVTYSVWPVFICGLAYLCHEAFWDRKFGKPFQAQTAIVLVVGTLLPIGLFFLIRKAVFTSNISSVGRTIKLIINDLNYAGQTFLGAAGFYVRKFLFPFPLNFAIREIDPLYNAAGAVVFIFCLYAIRRRSLNNALFLTGVCLFLPALPLSLGTVAWTAYAERYTYMSTAFWALTVSLAGGRYISIRGTGRIASAGVALILSIMLVCTFQRSIVWRTNLGLMSDTVKKSPGFKLILVDYMIALIGKGDLQGAKEQYRVAQTIPSVGYMEELDINMAAIHDMEGNTAEADKLYNHILLKTRGKSALAYEVYISFLQSRYAVANIKHDGSAPLQGMKLLHNMEKLYNLNKDPVLLYRSAQLALALGRCDDALRLFLHAGKVFPVQSDYARFSRRLADQLAAGRCRQERL